MLLISEKTLNMAWFSCLKKLWEEECPTDNDKYYRDRFTLIEIENPSLEPVPPEFPMSQDEIDIINRYIHSGENEEKVIHEWTKIYHRRIFSSPFSQMEFLIEKLQKKPSSGRAQISLWDKSIDQKAKIAPCTQIIWCRKKFDTLEMHVHAHSSNAYNKLLMNLQEFVALQYYIAEKVKIGVGRYFHIIDSCHIHSKDKEKVSQIMRALGQNI